MKRIQALLLMVSLLCLFSCKKWGDEDDYSPFKGMSAKQLYTEASTSLNKKEYTSAIKRFEALESMYPFSDYAETAQSHLIYAYYQNADYPSAAATAERFIHLYPRAENVDYAYYMKGLANFQQVRGTFSKALGIDESWRSPGTQTQAYADFTVLIQRFPHSRYKANALQRMIFLRNQFAERELNTANYYFERQMYVAAVERASYLVKTYPQAPSARAALVILYKANQALGLKQAAQDALLVYENTYHSKWVAN